MKNLILQVEDQAFEKLMGLIELCPSVTVESAYDSDSIQNQTDQCFASALSGMINANEFKSVSDYAYIMQLTIEDHLKCGTLFVNPDEFISYLKLLGFRTFPAEAACIVSAAPWSALIQTGVLRMIPQAMKNSDEKTLPDSF